MSFNRHLLRPLQHSSSSTKHCPPGIGFGNLLNFSRSFAFSTPEEAAAERRRRKHRLGIWTPSGILRPDPNYARPHPNALPDSNPSHPMPLPETTSALTGPRLNLHNRVRNLIRSGDVDSASTTARQALFSRTRPTVYTCNAVMDALLRARRFDDVVNHFHFFFRQSNIIPNVVSYNILINTHSDAGRVDSALQVYRHMLNNAPFPPSPVTYRHLTKGLIHSNRISEAMDLLREMLNKGHAADSVVYNHLMDGFLKLDNMEKALELFYELKERCLVYDGVVHATLMEAYFQKGMGKEAMDSFKELLARKFNMKAVTSNALLQVLIKYGKMNDAFDLFDHMLAVHVPVGLVSVNTDSYNLMVNECFRLRNIEEAVRVFRKTGPKPCAMDVGCYNNIIGKLCAEDGWVEEAEKLLDEMYIKSVNPDETTFEFLIDAYFREGKPYAAFQCFNKMIDTPLKMAQPILSIFGTGAASSEEPGAKHSVDVGVKAGVVFYNKVISGLVNTELFGEAQEILRRMAEKGVKPNLACYDSLLMALCKEGKLDQIKSLLDEMAMNDVALSPTLHETVLNAFGKEGWREGVERVLQQKISDSSASVPQFQQVAT